jgi:zinc transport system permease protein
MIPLSIIFGALFSFGGLWLSYELDLASGATIILLSGTVLLVTLGLSRLRKRAKIRETTSPNSEDR